MLNQNKFSLKGEFLKKYSEFTSLFEENTSYTPEQEKLVKKLGIFLNISAVFFIVFMVSLTWRSTTDLHKQINIENRNREAICASKGGHLIGNKSYCISGKEIKISEKMIENYR